MPSAPTRQPAIGADALHHRVHHVGEVWLPDRRIARCRRGEGLLPKHIKNAASQLPLKLVRLHGADGATRTDSEQPWVDFAAGVLARSNSRGTWPSLNGERGGSDGPKRKPAGSPRRRGIGLDPAEIVSQLWVKVSRLAAEAWLWITLIHRRVRLWRGLLSESSLGAGTRESYLIYAGPIQPPYAT